MNRKHAELQDVAIGWLYGKGCSVFAKEVPTWNGIADAVGVVTNQRAYQKPDRAYYIEAKASRSDLLCLKQKSCYKRTEGLLLNSISKEKQVRFGMEVEFSYPNDIDYFYFIVADGVGVEPTLYPLWGVMDERGKVLRKAKKMKKINDTSLKLITDIAHVLVYKNFGKLYLTPNPPSLIESV